MNPPHSSVSRACPTRRSRGDIAAIRAAILDIIGDDPPMTVRQVFYQLVSRGVIEKTEAQYQGTGNPADDRDAAVRRASL